MELKRIIPSETTWIHEDKSHPFPSLCDDSFEFSDMRASLGIPIEVRRIRRGFKGRGQNQ